LPVPVRGAAATGSAEAEVSAYTSACVNAVAWSIVRVAESGAFWRLIATITIWFASVESVLA